MLALSVLLVSPELLVGLVPGMLPQLGLLVVCTVVGLDHLVNGIVQNLLRLLRLQVLHGIVAVEWQAHEDTVQPNLVGIDSLVPIYTFLGARLVLELLEQGLQSLFISLVRKKVLHAEDKLRRANVVEIEILIFIAGDVSLLVNHLGRIFLQIVDDALVVGSALGTLKCIFGVKGALVLII